MNKKITLSIIGIFIVSVLLVIIVKSNTKEFVMYDGAMLALTIDGSPATSFPSDTNKYHVDIECDGGVGEYLLDDDYNMKFTIKDITKDGVKCFIDFTTIADSNKNYYLLKTKVESDNPTDNNGYRYSGKQPNNWVWFNNELWRIIGSIPTTLSDGETVENRVKIIKANSIGAFEYDSGSSSTTIRWGNNTLHTLLNEYYYGKKYIANSDPCKWRVCDFIIKGISSDSDDYYGRMIIDIYMNAGKVSDTSITISESYIKESSKLTSDTAKIGLMTSSDYGYAVSEIEYSSVNLDELGNYVQNNWLVGYGTEWRLTLNDKAYNWYAVRPVVYLDSSVYIISGNGTENNPYILGM